MKKHLLLILLLAVSLGLKAQETPPTVLKPVNSQFYINLADSAIWHNKGRAPDGTNYGWERLARYAELVSVSGNYKLKSDTVNAQGYVRNWKLTNQLALKQNAFTISGLATGDILQWSGTNWQNVVQTVSAPLVKSGQAWSITQADGTHNGYISQTDWNTFNNKANTTLSNVAQHSAVNGVTPAYASGVNSTEWQPGTGVGATSSNLRLFANSTGTNRVNAGSVLDARFSNATGIFTFTTAIYGAYGSAYTTVSRAEIDSLGIKLPLQTANRALYLDATNHIASSSTTDVEQGYVHGVTSAIQTQLNAKQGSLILTTTGTSGASTLIGNTLNIPQYGNFANTDLTFTGSRVHDLGTFGTNSLTLSSSAGAYKTKWDGYSWYSLEYVTRDGTDGVTGTPIAYLGGSSGGIGNGLGQMYVKNTATSHALLVNPDYIDFYKGGSTGGYIKWDNVTGNYTKTIQLPDTAGTVALKQYSPQVVKQGHLTGQTAVGTIVTYTVGATNESLIINADYNVTATLNIGLPFKITFTDINNNTVNYKSNSTGTAVGYMGAASGGVTTANNYTFPLIRAKAGTTVTVETIPNSGSLTSGTFDADAVITKLP